MSPAEVVEQRMRALTIANDTRVRRAELKRRLRAGVEDARPLLAEPPWWLKGMPVEHVLLAVPKLGPRKVTQILRRCNVVKGRTVGQLTDRQRLALTEEIDRAAGQALDGSSSGGAREV